MQTFFTPSSMSLLTSFSAVYLLKQKFFFTVSFFFCPVHSSENSYWLRFQYQQLPLTEHKELWLGLSLFGTSSNWLQNSYENTMQVHVQMWKYMSMYKQGVFLFMLQLWCADLERGLGTLLIYCKYLQEHIIKGNKFSPPQFVKTVSWGIK